MPAKQLKTFLDEAGVDYMCLAHPPAFTAQELAHHVKIAGDRVVKTVIIELDGKMAMLVMPATWRIRWDRLSKILDTDFVDLADEQAFQDRFPDCEVGAMPPFGNLFGMSVYCAEALTEQPELAFAAGTFPGAKSCAPSVSVVDWWWEWAWEWAGTLLLPASGRGPPVRREIGEQHSSLLEDSSWP